MKRDVWGYLFAGVSALAGIVYLYQAHNEQSQAPVTNVFPPLNTGDPTPASTGDPLPTQSNANNSTLAVQPSATQPWPVYLV